MVLCKDGNDVELRDGNEVELRPGAHLTNDISIEFEIL